MPRQHQLYEFWFTGLHLNLTKSSHFNLHVNVNDHYQQLSKTTKKNILYIVLGWKVTSPSVKVVSAWVLLSWAVCGLTRLVMISSPKTASKNDCILLTVLTVVNVACWSSSSKPVPFPHLLCVRPSASFCSAQGAFRVSLKCEPFNLMDLLTSRDPRKIKNHYSSAPFPTASLVGSLCNTASGVTREM